MTQEKIARINALAAKAKVAPLSPQELEERDVLRKEYIASIKASLTAHLDNTYIVDEHGTAHKLKKKEK